MTTMHVISPISRPSNLHYMMASIKEHMAPYFDVIWWVVLDAKEPVVPGGIESIDNIIVNVRALSSEGNGLSGNPQRNLAIDEIGEDAGYVHFLDDDNVLQRHGPHKYHAFLMVRPGCALVVSQMFKDGRIRLAADSRNMQPTMIDTAQFFLPFSMIGDLRWEPWNYCADGDFFSAIFKRHEERFYFMPQPMCWYNYLRNE